MYLAEMSWQTAESEFKKDNMIAIIPVGSTEQHGPIAPLGTDFLVPEYITKYINDHCQNVIILPTVNYGVCSQHLCFPGSINIGYQGMLTIMNAIFTSLFKDGVKKFIVINGHGGNDGAIQDAATDIFQRGALVALVDWWTIAPQLNSKWITGHGDAQETSAMMAIRPDLVNVDKILPAKIQHLTDNLISTHMRNVKFGKGTVKIIRDARTVTSNGAFGGLDVSKASFTWGKEMMQAINEYLLAFTEEFKTIKLN
jgi:creatinine amidohydrolase